MKRTLLIAFLFSSVMTFAQVVASQVDDFQDGTTQGWRIGNAAGPTEMPMNVADAGPNGAGDNCLQYTSTGGGGVASKMVIYSQNLQWSGNFTSENIENIEMDARGQTNDLNLRVAMQGSDGTRICSTNAVTLRGDGVWTNVIIPLSDTDFTVVSGSGTVASVLSNVTTFRLLSSGSPTWQNADIVAAVLQIDNVIANASLSTTEFQETEFTISPNPAKNNLNIKLSNADSDMKLEIFDVLGKRVHKGLITNLNSSVNVSNLKSGMYLVRISNDKVSQTKRFIKQ